MGSVCSKGRDAEAKVVLERLHLTGSNREWVDKEFEDIKETLRIERDIVRVFHTMSEPGVKPLILKHLSG